MGFILGTTLGTIFLTFLASLSVYFLYKKKSLKKLIKKLGKTAEDQINSDLKTWAKHTKNKFLDASIYHYEENKVFEVDSILITREAIIVIEIKSINGGIKGNSNEDYWMKVQGKNQFKISNPVKQNEKHIEHIIKMIGIKLPIISFVIFSNKAKFIDIKEKPSHVLIERHADIFDTLDKLTINLPIKLTEENQKSIFNKIKSFKANKNGKSLHKKITSGKGGK